MAAAQLHLLDKITQLERYIAVRGLIPEALAAEIDEIGIEKTLRRCVDSIRTVCAAAAKDVNLSYPLGIAHASGLIGPEYARLYRLVYGRLRDDIEAALDIEFGPAAFDQLLEVGRVSAPMPPASNFRSIIAGDPGQYVPPADIDKYQERREALGNRYAKAYLVLKADFWVHAVVDGVVILGHASEFLRTGGRIFSADDHMRRSALKKGLELLAEHFGYDRTNRRQGKRAATNGSAAPSSSRTGRGLPVMFSPQTDHRSAPADVSAPRQAAFSGNHRKKAKRLSRTARRS
jgi:hypothetical protein